MIILFETHATSVDNEAGLAAGQFDSDLSETGVRQAAELGERYAACPPDAIYCSDLRRSYRTAEIAFPHRSAVRDARLREIDYGEWTRRPAAAIEAEKLRRITSAFPGGESYQQACQRVQHFLQEIADDRTVLIVGHRAVYYALEQFTTGAPLTRIIAEPWHWQPGWHYRI